MGEYISSPVMTAVPIVYPVLLFLYQRLNTAAQLTAALIWNISEILLCLPNVSAKLHAVSSTHDGPLSDCDTFVLRIKEKGESTSATTGSSYVIS